MALRLAQHGAKLVISSRKAEACETVAEEIRANGGEAIVQPCNVSDKAQLQALADAAMKQWGRIDILVCNAAVNPFFGPSKDIPDDAFDKIMDVNIKRSEEHTSELQSLMRIPYDVFCLKKKTKTN